MSVEVGVMNRRKIAAHASAVAGSWVPMTAAIFSAMASIGCGKTNIEQTCTMNGLGQGSCSFTNLGDRKGARCGKIVVHGPDGTTEESATFCSGELPAKSTSEVGFSIPIVRSLCDGGGRSWSDVCSFEFVADGEKPRAIESPPDHQATEVPLETLKGWQKVDFKEDDGSTTHALMLNADAPVSLDPVRVATPTLLVQCSKGRTEVVIDFGMKLQVEKQSRRKQGTQLGLQIDDGEVEQQWATPAGEFATLPAAVETLKKLLDGDKLRVEFEVYRLQPRGEDEAKPAATFTVSGLREHIGDIRAACGW